MFKSFKINEEEVKEWGDKLYDKGHEITVELRKAEYIFKNAFTHVNSLREMSHVSYTSKENRIAEIDKLNEKIKRFGGTC